MLVSSVWMIVDKNQLVHWTLGIPEMIFSFFLFFLRPFLTKLSLLEGTTFITPEKNLQGLSPQLYDKEY
jgi:hypothetical protein